MKRMDWKYSWFWLLLCLVSCTQADDPLDIESQTTAVRVSVSPMTMTGELQTRATFPLSPERENMIRTLALLVFDQEGQHVIGNSTYYEFMQVAGADAPDGKLTVEKEHYSGSVSRGTLCAIGNMPEEALLAALREKAAESEGSAVISLAQFKELTIDLPYIEKADSVGLVSNVYMFGYYEGDLKPTGNVKSEHVEITMGRIVTRLDVSLSTVYPNNKYAIRLRNTSRKAYIFPGERSPEEPPQTDNYFYPIALTATPQTLYYYVGPHSAESEDKATCIDIAYGGAHLTDADFQVSPNDPSKKYMLVSVALCNEPPGTENRNFWLNRNSVYNISINLVRKKSLTENTSTRTPSTPGVYEVVLEGLDE